VALKLRGKKCLILKRVFKDIAPNGSFCMHAKAVGTKKLQKLQCKKRRKYLHKCKSFNAKRGGNTCTNAKALMQKRGG
jgi:hypothetical protein